LIYDIYLGLLALCLVTLLLRYKQLPRYCLWFIPIIFFALAVEIIKSRYEEFKNILQRVYQAIECLLLFCFFYKLLKKPANKRLIKIGYVAYVITTVLYYSVFAGDKVYYVDFLIEAFMVCVLVCLFFLELLDHQGQLQLLYFAAFWLNAAHLIFYGGTFFAMSYEYIGKEKSYITQIPYYLNIVLYSWYLVTFAFFRKKMQHAE
jgi:hypothetical protein